ncbi:MAG TPA: preprotein translocase subunit SecE [Methylophilaceae bacterium]
MIDKLRLLLAIALVGAGIAGFYMLGDGSPAVVRALSVMGGIVAAVAVMWTSRTGQAVFVFSKESIAEARRVVWPSRKETIQTTGVVVVIVILMAIFMWIVDISLLSLVRMIMGRGE